MTARTLAGDPVTAVLTKAPGNGAPIGGLKVTTEQGWFAARPSGTEDVYKVYAESFRGEEHLERLIEEAQALVSATVARRLSGPSAPVVERDPRAGDRRGLVRGEEPERGGDLVRRRPRRLLRVGGAHAPRRRSP